MDMGGGVPLTVDAVEEGFTLCKTVTICVSDDIGPSLEFL